MNNDNDGDDTNTSIMQKSPARKQDKKTTAKYCMNRQTEIW